MTSYYVRYPQLLRDGVRRSLCFLASSTDAFAAAVVR